MAPEPEPHSEPDTGGEPVPGAPDTGPGRRRPRYGRFLLTGAILGFLVALVAARLAPRTASYVWTDVLRYLALLAILIGALLGGVVAVLLDRTAAANRSSPPRRRGRGGRAP